MSFEDPILSCGYDRGVCHSHATKSPGVSSGISQECHPVRAHILIASSILCR
ncbi:hypothetical protein IEO21_08371 [Rhodonia placenta]|uniref:Uncharacterized protein n=1 Tax=Rhodonia placenta TaxID=104341 RepID=A0A8H7TYT3_9APHY|nr:hypothetical protein IEO21_08371 [Postia placenta]